MKFTFNLNKKEFNMRKIVSKFALAAGLVLAMALTFSCSSDDGGSSRATYWYSMYGIPDASSTNYIFGLANQNASYNDVKYVWSEIKRIGIWIESYNGVSEQEIKDFLIQRDASPKEADDFIARLKKRGNSIAPFNSNDPRYYMFMFYVERE
jgi:hypothetical protein